MTFRAAVIALLLAHGVTLAQTDAGLRPVLSRIVNEAAARSEVMDLARELTDVYGPRLTGSPHLKAAGDVVIRRLKRWGVESVRFERWGPFGPGWTTDRFVALAVSPVPFPLHAYPKAWTPGTSGDLVAEAILAVVQTDEDFKAYRGRLRGKFVLTASIADVTARSDRPMPAAAALSAAPLEFLRRRMGFFLDEGVAALLEPGGSSGGVVVTDGRLRDDAAFGGNGFYPWPDPVAAQVVIATEHYNRIGRMLQRGTAVTLEMNIASTYHPAEPDSFNIIAEIPGTDLAREVVMIGAHFDSWHAGTGAVDNAAGCAVMLEAMRILEATGLEMRRTVRLALWTGSEQGLLGSRGYVTEHFADPAVMQLKPEHQLVSGYFNLDGGSGAIRGISLPENEPAAGALEDWIAAVRDQGVTTLSRGSARSSDHRPFEAVGIPAFDFMQDPLDYETTRHSSADTYDRLQQSDLVRNAGIVASLVYYVANRNEQLPRKPLPKPDPSAAGPWSPGR